MTINTTSSRVTYNGDGSSTSFAVTFPFFSSNEIEVIERVTATGVETLRSLTTHYTVTGGNGSTGTVTAVTAPASTVSWTIRRKTAQTQLVDYTPGDPFPAETHERALDRAAARDQELQEELNRSLRFPKTDSASLGTLLPSSVDRANKALVFAADGSIGVSADIALQASNAAASASAAASSASAASSSASSASTSASNASSSASSASTSASNASTSASTATTQASNASTSASTASTAASNASASATAAANSASAAALSESNAATSASNASSSATAAAASASSASAAQGINNPNASQLPTPSLYVDFLRGALDSRLSFSRSGNGWAFDRSGSLTQYGSNIPRFDHNPSSGEIRGLLIEAAATNSIRNNSGAGAAAGAPGTLPTNWVQSLASGVSREVIGTGTENGIDYVDIRFSGTPSASGGCFMSFDGNSAIAASASQAWSGSLFVRLVGGSTSNIVLGSNNTGLQLLPRDSGGTSLGGSAFGTYTPTASTLRTQRIAVHNWVTPASTAFVQAQFRFGVTNGAAIDVTFRFGLPQLEQAAFVSSPIRTSAGAVTRNADSCSIATSAFGFNAAEGCLFAEGDFTRATQANAVLAALELASGAANNRIMASRVAAGTSLQNIVTNGGSEQANMAASVTAAGIHRSAINYQANNFAASINGATALTDSSGTLPSPDTLRLGGNGSSNLNDCLRRIAVWPRLLPTSLLQDITNTARSNALLDGYFATPPIANDAISNAMLANMAANSIKANNTGSSGDPADVAIAASRLVGRGSSGNLGEISLGTGLSFSGSTINGTDPQQIIKAWVNFNGTGTVAIRDSFNVSTITDHGTGDYSINFTNAMPNANYAVVGLAGRNAAGSPTDPDISIAGAAAVSTTAFRIYTYPGVTGTLTDFEIVNLIVIGD